MAFGWLFRVPALEHFPLSCLLSDRVLCCVCVDVQVCTSFTAVSVFGLGSINFFYIVFLFYFRQKSMLDLFQLTWSRWQSRRWPAPVSMHVCVRVHESNSICCQGLHQQHSAIIVALTHFTLALPLWHQGAIKHGCLPQSTHPSTGTRHYLNPLISNRTLSAWVTGHKMITTGWQRRNTYEDYL